jgi:hypothetical protein
MSNNKTRRCVVQSFGGGTQSVALLVLVAQGKLPRTERIVMADTTHEGSATWIYFDETVRPLVERLGVPLDMIQADGQVFKVYVEQEYMQLPAYTLTGKLPAACSNKWKRDLIRRHLRSLGYGPSKSVVQWLGMSFDELDRMRNTGLKWIEHAYPLVDLRLRRDEAIARVLDYGLPRPPRSSCYFCPNRTNDEWLDLYKNWPGDWAKAVKTDYEIRAWDTERGNGGLWLHRDRVPLDEVDLKKPDNGQLELFPCGGYCGS